MKLISILKTLIFHLIGLLLCVSISGFTAEVSVQVEDAKGNPVQDAVVYIESANTKTMQPDTKSVAIEQRGKKFNPLVTVIQAGTQVSFPNRDSVRHHVYSFSPPKTFELKLYAGVPANPVVFDKAGTEVLGCNIHDNMLAFIQVVETPYFGKTDAAGKVKIIVNANGEYQLKTWHFALSNEGQIPTQAINIKGNEQVTVKLDLKPFQLPN